MRLCTWFFASDGSAGFIALNGNTRSTAYVVYGKDEGRRVITEFAVQDDRASDALGSIEASLLEPVANTPTAIAEGASVETLSQAALHLKHLVGDDPLRAAFVGAVSRLYHLSASKKGELTSALMSYVDQDGEHHTVIFTCKQGARTHVRKDMLWLSTTLRASILQFIEESELVESTRVRDAHLTGHIAASFNVAFTAQTEAAKRPAS